MTDLTATQKRHAWETFACDKALSGCGEKAGRRCVTSSGARTTPHKLRLDLERGWLSRQGEVDRLLLEMNVLNGSLNERAERIAALNANLADVDRQLETALSQAAEQRELTRLAEESRDVAQRRVGELVTQVGEFEQELGYAELAKANLKAEAIYWRDWYAELSDAYDDHMATHEQPTKTFFGACPEKPGGTSLAAAQTVVDKWGKGAAVRQFLGGITTVAPRPTDAGIVHVSWKEFNQSNITPANVTRACANLLASDCVEIIHESDNDRVKLPDGSDRPLNAAEIAKRVALKSFFYDTVKAVRPDLLVVNTVTGWLMDPKSGKDPSPWGQVKADVLGIDCDGIRPTKLPYTDYTAETTAALAFIEKHKTSGYRYVAVPEFGCPRIPAADPDGSIRAAYHAHYADLWTSAGFLYCTLYEYDSSPHYSLTTPAELDQWRTLVR